MSADAPTREPLIVASRAAAEMAYAPYFAPPRRCDAVDGAGKMLTPRGRSRQVLSELAQPGATDR